MNRISILALFIVFLSIITIGQSETIICQDNFDNEPNNQPPTFWTTATYCKVTATTSWTGTKSVNTRNQGYMKRACSTEGWTHVFLGFFYRVDGLDQEDNDQCIAEYSINGGSTWINIATYNHTFNGAAWQNGGINLPSTDVNAPGFVTRFRSNSNSNNDYCYWDAWSVSVF